MCRKLILLVCVVAVLGTVDFAYGHTRWNGTDSNDFCDPCNWNNPVFKGDELAMVIDKSPWRDPNSGDYTPNAPYLFRYADPNVFLPGDFLRGPGYDAGTRADWFIRPGGWFHCASAWRMCYNANTTGYTEMTGGTLIFDGVIRCPHHADANAAIVLLHGGTITAPSISFGPQGLFDFAGDGTLILDSYPGIIADVEGWVAAENITAYDGAGTVVYDCNVTNPGKTTITSEFGHAAAWNPSPEYLAEDVCPDVNLGWTEGDSADTHTIYFGPSPNDVNVSTADPCEEGYDSNSWKPPALELGKTYYWRIVEVNDGNEWVGSVWQFTVETGKARDPSPGDDMKGVPVDANLSWTASCLADSHDMYFGASWADVNSGGGDTSKGGQSSPYDPGPLDAGTWYYWRVDEVGDTTIKGDVWSFKTQVGVLLYYSFDGSEGTDLPSEITYAPTNITFTKYIDPNYPDPCGIEDPNGSVKYSEPNPLIYTDKTSADFEPFAGLYRLDTGDGDILRLDYPQYTIEMWIYVNSGDYDSKNMMVIGKGEGMSDDREPWSLMLSDLGSDDDLRWYHNGDRTENDVMDDNLDEWIHVAAVFDQSLPTANRKLYLNGEVIADDTDHDTNPADNNDPVGIGCQRDADGTFDDGMFFDGRIDELRILDVALQPIQFLYPRAADPSPEDGEGDIDPNDPNDPNVVLSWTPWAGANQHDVYFGTNYVNVRDGNNPNVYIGRVDSNSYIISDVCDLEYATTYYWRIDEVNGSDAYTGVVWQFLTKYQIVDPNLLLWYPYDEMEGDWVYDHSGHGLHGQNGDVSDGWDPDGRFDGCLEFDDNMGFDLEKRTLSNINKEITIAVWLDGYREEDDNWVINAGADGNFVEVIVPDPEDDYVYWRAGNDSNDLLIWNDATPSDWVGDWHHFAFVKNENAGTMSIYFDGEVAKSKSGTISSLSNIANTDFSVGAKLGNSADYVGKMDDLRVYDYALSKKEIAGLFRGGDIELAWGPSPYDGQPDARMNADLSWKPGDYADLHDVYFGTDFDEVSDANTSNIAGYPDVNYARVDVNSYDLDTLDLGETYYWRVDEFNDPCTWRGKVWRFKVAEFIVIDNMEDYTVIGGDYPIAGFAEPRGWDCGYNNDTSSALGLVYPGSIYTVAAHRSDQAMNYYYGNDDNSGLGYYSEISNHFTMDPNDWTSAGVKMLTLWFYGTAGNDANEQVYVGLEDISGIGSYSQVDYGDEGEDMNDIKLAEWQEWNIPLNKFTTANPGLDLTCIKKLYIGFGERGASEAGGIGYMYFDDIRLYQPTCVPSMRKPDYDLNDDCIVDFGDIQVMAEDWLKSDVNLGEVTKPSDANLVGWWMLDEGSGGITYDSSGNDNDGVIETIETNVEWVTGHNDVNYALDFAGGRVLVSDDGDTPELNSMSQLTVSAWVNYSQTQEQSSRIVVKGADNAEKFSFEINNDDEFVFLIRDANKPKDHKYDVNGIDKLEHDEWIHLAGTYDGNNVLSCYVNGELRDRAEDVNLIEGLCRDPNYGLAIGNRSDATSRAFTGTIDDVRVYNSALSPEEIAYITTDSTGIMALESVADIYKEARGKGVINLKDFAVLADTWLEEKLYPE